MALLDGLSTEVTRNAELIQRAITKIDELKASAADPVKVAELEAAVKSSNDALEAKLSE